MSLITLETVSISKMHSKTDIDADIMQKYISIPKNLNLY